MIKMKHFVKIYTVTCVYIHIACVQLIVTFYLVMYGLHFPCVYLCIKLSTLFIPSVVEEKSFWGDLKKKKSPTYINKSGQF